MQILSGGGKRCKTGKHHDSFIDANCKSIVCRRKICHFSFHLFCWKTTLKSGFRLIPVCPSVAQTSRGQQNSDFSVLFSWENTWPLIKQRQSPCSPTLISASEANAGVHSGFVTSAHSFTFSSPTSSLSPLLVWIHFPSSSFKFLGVVVDQDWPHFQPVAVQESSSKTHWI